MRKYIYFLLSLLVAVVPVSGSALTTGRTAIQRIDSVKRHLAQATTYVDSIRDLNTLVELNASRSERIKLGEKIYNSSLHQGDYTTTCAIIRSLARVQAKDAAKLEDLAARVDHMPACPEKDETGLYIDLLQIDLAVDSRNGNDVADNLSKIVAEFRADTITDTNSRIKLLYTLCCHLRLISRGNLLMNYYERLDNILSTQPFSTGAVRNLVYNRSAPIFTANGEHARAVAIDKKLLNSIDSLQETNAEFGGRYRDLTNIKYTCFTRMLSNYKALTPNEIESYYNRVLDLADKNEAIAADLDSTQMAHIYYNLAIGNDKWSLEALKRQLEKTDSWSQRYYYLSALTEVAQRLGDRQTAGHAAIELNQMLQDRLNNRTDEHYRELQVIYDVKELSAEREELIRQAHAKEMRNNRIAIAVVILVLIIVGISLVFSMRRNHQIHQITKKLKMTADKLRHERNNLQSMQEELIEARDQAKAADRLKTEFVNNMSHEVQAPLNAIAEYSRLIVDCIPEDQARYLDRYADIIDVNTKLVTTLVSDVLDVNALERNQMSVDLQPVEVQRICKFAIDDVFENSPENKSAVKFVFNPDNKPDFTIETDGKRVAQVLINLLDNARKFTERGTITLDYQHDTSNNTVSFTVTDTGIGIPRAQEEDIFTRFRKLNSNAKGYGLGLYISRLIASLLGGTLKVDSAYRTGARFILTIPA